MSRLYTDEELLDIIRKKQKELGRTPKFTEVSQCKTIQDRFGSWNEGLKKAGLKANRKRDKEYYKLSKKELIKILKNKANNLGRTPVSTEVGDRLVYAIKKKFGTWNN